MVTKSKNSTKRRCELVLAAGWLLVSMMVTFSNIFFDYYFHVQPFWSERGADFYKKSWFLLAVAAAVLGIALICGTVSYLRKFPLRTSLSPCRIERIRTELLMILCYLSGVKWVRTFQMGKLTVWNRYIINNIVDTVTFTALLFLLLGVFFGSIVLIVRQWARGILWETSFVLEEIRKYMQRTPLETKLQNKYKRPLVLSVIFTLLLLWFAFQSFWTGRDSAAICSAVTAILILAVFIRTIFSAKINREIGCLLEQIRAISEGKEVPSDRRLPETSLLYEASLQLENIDQSMQKSVEKQIQAERLKIDLITNVSHDLKTPLTSMVGYTDLLKKEELSEEARDYVDIISFKQEHLKNMIQDLFELSKATSGADKLELETLDMRKLLEQTMADMADRIEESGRTIRSTFPEEPLLFVGDNGKMYRVVQNLLENALKYSLPDTRIYLEAAKQENQIEVLLKNVASYEMDFAPEEITERFARGDKSRSTEGHGLGLAIASSFVKNMGGSLEIAIDGDLFKVMMRFPGVTK